MIDSVGGFSGIDSAQIEQMRAKMQELQQARFNDADGNGDGVLDLVLVDTQAHFIELVRYDSGEADAAQRLRKIFAFQVFEEKNFSRQSAGGAQPREAIIADVTGDKRNDLVLLIHDRILVYPQDPGPEE